MASSNSNMQNSQQMLEAGASQQIALPTLQERGTAAVSAPNYLRDQSEQGPPAQSFYSQSRLAWEHTVQSLGSQISSTTVSE